MPDNDNRPYVVEVDIYIARRKRMHAVHDPVGLPVFHAPLLIDVLNWFAEKDIHAARFTDQEDTFDVTFTRRPPGRPNQEFLDNG